MLEVEYMTPTVAKVTAKYITEAHALMVEKQCGHRHVMGVLSPKNPVLLLFDLVENDEYVFTLEKVA
jgi:hypothetical protein